MKQTLAMTRRRFGALATGTALCGLRSPSAAAAWLPSASTLTAQQVIDRVRSKARDGWSQGPPEGLIAGDPSVHVTGIATTAMPTVTVLRQAAAAGRNLIFTCEPTFFSMADGRALPAGNGWQGGPPGGGPPGGGPPGGGGGRPGGGGPPPQAGIAPDDPVLVAKKKLIAESGLVIYRIGDHWTAGEDMSLAMGDALGWSKYRVDGDPFSYQLPAGTLGTVLAEVTARLSIRGGMRVVGDQSWPVRRVTLLPGLRPFSEMPKFLPQSDLVLVGETRDWEGPEYFSDAKAAGLKKSYAQVGRVVSQEPGMMHFSRWLGTAVPGLPVQRIETGDPYWRPRA